MSVDTVSCVRCLVWPPKAADWPTRHRNYGWPESATLDLVVSNGCDVVGLEHFLCKKHKLFNKYHWRLSFSRAEIVLINSWMPVQQIVYHMLRYFVKTERLTDCADNSGAHTLSNFHIKTLMLWTCEVKPRSWWTENVNLVRICVELLNTLSVWLRDIRCPHYFVSNCNLIDNSFNVRSAACKLMSIDEIYLSTWFVNNYIKQCAQLCPPNISQLFNDVDTSMKLQNAASEIVHWRVNNSLHDKLFVVQLMDFGFLMTISVLSLTRRSYVYWVNELTKIDSRLSIYFAAITLLHIAHIMTRKGFSDELKDILEAVLGPNFNSRCSMLSLHETEPITSELVALLQSCAIERLTTYRRSMAREFGQILTTDYEALYAYKRGNYQRCLQLSTENVHSLLAADDMVVIGILVPEIIQLLDDDIVSLTALIQIVDPRLCCKYDVHNTGVITQLTLLLYLMTQCQLKLYHPATSIAQTLQFINLTQRRYPPERTLIQLTLKIIERKARAAIYRNDIYSIHG